MSLDFFLSKVWDGPLITGCFLQQLSLYTTQCRCVDPDARRTETQSCRKVARLDHLCILKVEKRTPNSLLLGKGALVLARRPIGNEKLRARAVGMCRPCQQTCFSYTHAVSEEACLIRESSLQALCLLNSPSISPPPLFSRSLSAVWPVEYSRSSIWKWPCRMVMYPVCQQPLIPPEHKAASSCTKTLNSHTHTHTRTHTQSGS